MKTWKVTIRTIFHEDGTISESFLTFDARTSMDALHLAVAWCQRHNFETSYFRLEEIVNGESY